MTVHSLRIIAISPTLAIAIPSTNMAERIPAGNHLIAGSSFCSLCSKFSHHFYVYGSFIAMLQPASSRFALHSNTPIYSLALLDSRCLCSLFTICGDACPLSCVNACEACVNVCCATLLSSELVGPACVQARSSNPRGMACRPSGKGSGGGGILGDVLPVYLYCPAFSVSVSLGV